MKTKLSIILIIIFWVIFPNRIFSQISLKFDINCDTISINKYQYKKEKDKKKIFLSINLGSYEIKNPKAIKKIKGMTVEKVEMIFTDYPKDFDMGMLNKQRLISLFLLAPELFNNSLISWKFVKQTGASKKNIYNFRHGFVITYTPAPTWTGITSKKEYFKDVLSGKTVLKDSSILKIFDRHKDWDDMVIVCDFTGSMSPYIAEMLLWYHLNFNEKKNQSFVFFNDGNRTPDKDKKIGKTGGIFDTDIQNIDSVLNTAVKTIENGFGGDGPENDIEALLYAVRKFPEKKNIVLIADNWSTMRDYSLIKKIDKPVKIILCGAVKRINTEYMDLAYKTGGSIHTIEEDIIDLVKLKEGEKFIIDGTVFQIKNGKFVVIEGS